MRAATQPALLSRQCGGRKLPDTRTPRQAAALVAWAALEAAGGLYPPHSEGTPPAGMLEGLGEYDAAAVQAIVRDTMRSAPVDRVWPWIARAIYRYEVELAADGFADLAEPSADKLLEQAAKQAKALRQTLYQLSLLSFKSPAKVGAQNHANALRFGLLLSDHFTDRADGGGSRSAFLSDLAALAAMSKQAKSDTLEARKRGALNPFLAGLVADLAEVWSAAIGTKPSAADPVRKDGQGGPFVRLVNGCLSLADGNESTSEQIKTALATLG